MVTWLTTTAVTTAEGQAKAARAASVAFPERFGKLQGSIPAAGNIQDFIKAYQYHHAHEYGSALTLCALLLENNYTAEAKPILESFLLSAVAANQQLDIDALELLRALYEREGSPEQYMAFLRSLPTNYALKPILLLDGASYVAQQSDARTVDALLSSAIAEFPSDVDLRTAAAEHSEWRGDLHAALMNYREVLKLDAGAAAYAAIGRLYCRLGDYDAATEAFATAVSIDAAYAQDLAADFSQVAVRAS